MKMTILLFIVDSIAVFTSKIDDSINVVDSIAVFTGENGDSTIVVNSITVFTSENGNSINSIIIFDRVAFSSIKMVILSFFF